MKEEVNFGPSPQKKNTGSTAGQERDRERKNKGCVSTVSAEEKCFFPPRPLIIIKVQHEANSKGGTCMSVRTAGDR